MKDGKIDVKSVGITIALAIVGVCIGLSDFISQRVNVMNFLSEIMKIKPVVTTEIVGSGTEVLNGISGFGGITMLVLVVAIIAIACAMFSIKGMA